MDRLPIGANGDLVQGPVVQVLRLVKEDVQHHSMEEDGVN